MGSRPAVGNPSRRKGIRNVTGHRAPSMLLLGTICVSGCVSVDERQIRSGVYVIATPASEFVNSEERARVILNLRAQELCPKGFMRFREDRVSNSKGIEIMAWQVACTM